jgi:hypothetical protein
MARTTWFSGALLALVACSAQGRDIGSSPGGPGASTGSAPGQPGPDGSTNPGINSGNDGGSSTATLVDEVYGQSGYDLYRLDPTSKAVTHVGAFEGCNGGVIDIALDADSNLFGTTSKGLYRIDRKTAKCTSIASGDYPNSLSFVPKGTVDANEEALVGYNDDVYVRIDTKSGDVSTIGSLGQGYTSSGDIVSVIGGGTYLTVKGQGCSDCIVEVNPATGAMKRKLGSLGHKDVFGLAFWAGNAYGFDLEGELFEVNFNGNSVSTKPISIPKAPADLAFWGAGSTTSAPVTAVK